MGAAGGAVRHHFQRLRPGSVIGVDPFSLPAFVLDDEQILIL
jgi:hypothetical protein